MADVGVVLERSCKRSGSRRAVFNLFLSGPKVQGLLGARVFFVPIGGMCNVKSDKQKTCGFSSVL
jgi:hypothetical protein